MTESASIELKDVVKRYGGVSAIEGVNLDIASGEIVSLLGPSGCGKTTTLRCISGLEAVSAGSISIGGEVVSRAGLTVPTHRRGVGLVFQSYALWPHLKVIDNIAYGLKVLRRPREEVRARSLEMLETVGLSGLADRLPAELSGGQQQRVALARSLVVRPRVLLLDEPMSNLDAGLRDRMRREVRAILKEVGITAVYVTHDQREAIGLSDRIVLMRSGRIEQIDDPESLYRRPRSVFAATFLGSANLVTVDGLQETATRGYRANGDGIGEVLGESSEAPLGGAAAAMIRPENVRIDLERSSGGVNVWPGTIIESSFEGPTAEYVLDCGGVRLRCIGRGGDRLPTGTPVTASIDPMHVRFLPLESSAAR